MKQARGHTPEAKGKPPRNSQLATRNPPESRLPSLAARMRSVARVVRTIIGAPDYDRYVAHARRCHPDRVPLSRDEFARERLQARYSQPGNRCC